MPIWIDGDACPRVIKDVLFRAAVRTRTLVTIVANHTLQVPPSPFIKRHQVSSGFDVADDYIVTHLKELDLVITADIPLADAAISAGAVVLNPRGEMYSITNIKQHLAMRNLNESLRSCQLISGGPEKISSKEVQNFANNLDKWLFMNRR